jgi:hypothetical protein
MVATADKVLGWYGDGTLFSLLKQAPRPVFETTEGVLELQISEDFRGKPFGIGIFTS